MANDTVEIKIDVEVLKTQMVAITQLCTKMDNVIAKLIDNHDKVVNQIYNDMRQREEDMDNDVKELHVKINNVSKELSEKVDSTERRIMNKIEELKKEISNHNRKEDDDLKKILQWKWMVVGGFVALAWVISNINLTNISKLFS